jgi:hypothetical protein
MTILNQVENYKSEPNLLKVIRELQTWKITDPHLLQKAISVMRLLRGPFFADRLKKDFALNNNYNGSFSEKILFLWLLRDVVEVRDLKTIFLELKDNPSLQTEKNWAYFLALCAFKGLNRDLDLLKTKFSDAFELPFVRLMMVQAYFCQLKFKSPEVWTLLEPLENLAKSTENFPIWNTFLSYFWATKNVPKLQKMLSQESFSTLPSSVLFKTLRVASFCKDLQKIEEIFSLMKNPTLSATRFYARAQVRFGDFRKAFQALSQHPDCSSDDIFRLALFTVHLKNPLIDRKEIATYLTSPKLKVKFFIQSLRDSTKGSSIQETTQLLKETLSIIESENMKQHLSQANFRSILKVISKTEDKIMYYQYFNEMRRLFPSSKTQPQLE